MLARRNRRAGMPDADSRIAGRLHHDVHRAAGNRARAVIGEGRSRDPLRIPADGAARFAGAVAIEVDDDGHFKSRRVRHLRQEHRAEFSGADQRDANRLAGRKAGVEEAMKVHERMSDRSRRVPDAVQRLRAAPQSRDQCAAINECGPRLSSASFRAALRPGHDDECYSAAWRWARASRTSASSSTVWIGVKSRWAIYSGRVGVRM